MVIWLFFLKIAAVALQVHGQSPQGFISIDCGIVSNSSYIDSVTNLSYISDDQYVNTGSIHDIETSYDATSLPSQVLNLRSFPDGDQNCYTVPVVQDQRYLVRAWFMYGNYDGKNSANKVTPLQFDLHLGANLWWNINITDASIIAIEEALTLTSTDSISICLVNTGNGDPFISALELRPLKNTMYNLSQSNLALVTRVDMGSLTNDFLRYPNDTYDRLWRPWKLDSLVTISTELSINSQGDGFEAPSSVLQTALTAPEESTSLTYFQLFSESNASQFYTVLHFTEVQVLAGNSVRKFDIYRNNQLLSRSYSPRYLKSGGYYDSVPFNGSTEYTYWLNATADSTLPPLINALEIYVVMPAVGAGA